MTPTRTREIRLKSRPVGMPTADNFELHAAELGEPGPGEVQVKNLWMTVDPYMRGRMNEGRSYVAPFEIGKALQGGAIGEVIASNDPALARGDLVQSMYGWREAFKAKASSLQKLDTHGLPPQAFLGVAGMPGLTAYAGLIRVASLKEGDVVFVSAAAGAVGSVVCQIAKIRGHRVIGSAGGPEKAAFLKEIGVDAVIDYKAVPDLTAALREAAPEGIDVYFENVGGEHLEAAITCAKPFARFAMCGMIASYNATTPPPGPRNMMMLIGKRLRLQGFIVGDHADMMPAFLADISRWITEGKLTWKETTVEGIENAPEALLTLFRGGNLGKMLVKLG